MIFTIYQSFICFFYILISFKYCNGENMPSYHPLLHFILYFLSSNCQTKILNQTDNEIFHVIPFTYDTYCLLWKRNRLTKLFVSFFNRDIYAWKQLIWHVQICWRVHFTKWSFKIQLAIICLSIIKNEKWNWII